MVGHLLAFVLLMALLGIFRVFSGHAMGIGPSLVLALPCEVAGVILGHRMKAWMRG